MKRTARRSPVLLSAMALSLLLLACREGVTAASKPEKVDFRLKSVDGRTLGPNDFHGQVVVVDFWATWCVPCHVQTRILEPIHRDYKGKGVQFLAANVGEDEPTVRSFLKNKPYDVMTRELLTARGSNRPGDADFDGAVNFLLAHSQEKATPATAKVSQVFLGVQVQCTQCHNHPVAEARQSQFWELNSFLRQMQPRVIREDGKVVAAHLIDGDFTGESGQTPDATASFCCAAPCAMS